MARDDLQWITIEDFTPGIRQRGHQPLGAASDTTYGCIATATGELVPLPASILSYVPTPPDNFVNVQSSTYYLNGFHVTGPLTGAATASGTQDEFHIGWEWLKTAGAPNPHREYRWERHQIFANPVVVNTVYSYASGATPSASTRGTFFEDVRMDPAVATNPGIPLVAAAWYEEGGSPTRFVSVYPDPTTPSTNSKLDISGSLPADIIVAHQGRLVIFEQRGWSHGSPGSWISNEQIWFTNINLPTLEPTVAQTFATDRMTGIGVAKSVSASEFLIVKFDDGAYAAAGDLANPTVIRLPGVHPTQGATVVPVYTPLGLVYGALFGSVHAWGGGDSSIDLAPNMNPSFWRHPNYGRWVNYNGKFALWDDVIATPRGWLLDTKTRGWWRLNDIAATKQYLHMDTDYQGTLFAAYDQVTAGGEVAVNAFPVNGTGQHVYFWQSVPLLTPVHPGRRLSVREIVIEAKGLGTVTVGITGDELNTDADVTFTIPTSSYPVIIRKAVNTQTSGNIAPFITSTGDGSTGAAPTIYSIRFGYRDEASINAT